MRGRRFEGRDDGGLCVGGRRLLLRLLRRWWFCGRLCFRGRDGGAVECGCRRRAVGCGRMCCVYVVVMGPGYGGRSLLLRL